MTQRPATAASLIAVLKASAAGDAITFTGALSVKALAGDYPGVMIKAEAGATIGGWPDGTLSGVTFSGFTKAGAAVLGLWATKGGKLAIEDCTFEGAGLIQMVCVETRRCTFANMAGGISIQGGGGHLVEDCTFTGLSEDGINVKADGAVTIRGNRFTQFRGEPVHRDCIQLLAGSTNGGLILIERNVYERGEGGTPVQGIFSDAAPGPIVARRNAFLGGPWQTISIYGIKPGSVIEDNFLQGYNDPAPGTVMTPWIKATGATVETLIRNNVTVGAVDAPGAKLTGNTRISNASPGDRGALVAWLAGTPQPAPAPAPAPQPAPVSALAAMTKERDALAAKIAAAILALTPAPVR